VASEHVPASHSQVPLLELSGDDVQDLVVRRAAAHEENELAARHPPDSVDRAQHAPSQHVSLCRLAKPAPDLRGKLGGQSDEPL
jgi:hypothetical protein